MQRYAVGECVDGFKTYQEGVHFDMTDAGAQLVILFNGPTPKEIDAVRTGDLKFGLFTGATSREDFVIFILFRAGALKWMDAPYSVHLSRDLTRLQEPQKGQGYGCMIILADCSTGEVKTLRLVGLSTHYSKALKAAIEEQRRTQFSEDKYNRAFRELMSIFPTTDMVKHSLANCKITR